MKLARLAIALAAVSVVVVIGGYLAAKPAAAPVSALRPQVRTVEVKGEAIRVEVADTESTRERGLSGRSGLAADEGMLFIFPDDGEYPFWMKDMLFSIDMVWISADGKVVYMALNVSPDTYPQVFRPEVPARYVLELPSGYAREHGIRIGDIVRL